MELAGAVGFGLWDHGDIPQDPNREGGRERERGVTVGWEASEGSHRGMFQLAGHVLLHCSLASIIHMYAHEACWEQTSDMHCLEKSMPARKAWKDNVVTDRTEEDEG